MNIITLGDIADIITGPFGSQLHKSDYVDEGYPLIMPQNICDRIIDFEDISRISEEDASRLKRYEAEEYDIIYARRGDVEKHAFVVKEYGKVFCGTGCLRVRVERKVANPLFVSFYLNRPECRQWISKHAVGSNMPNINTDILSAVPLRLPSLDEQHRISIMLNKIDEKILNNNAINDNLMHQAQLLYDHWFIRTTEVSHYFDSNYINKNSINIPSGWNLMKVSEAFDICYGFPFNADLFTEVPTSIPVVRIRDIPTGSTETYTTEAADSKYVLKPTDLLIGMDGNFHMNLWCTDGAMLNQRCIRIRKTDYPVLIAYFSTMPFIKSREKNVSRTTVGHLSAGDINDLIILVPPKHISDHIMPLFDSIAKFICYNRLENQRLTSYRDWILPMLMNGQATIED